MDFRIRSQATQPLQPGRSPTSQAAKRTSPLEESPARPAALREIRAMAVEPAPYLRSELKLEDPGLENPRPENPGLEAHPDFLALRARGNLKPEVLAQLQLLRTQPLAAGIDRSALLATALQELADPERIGQGSRHTCAAAVVQAKLAQDDPCEYLRLLSGLASPAGEVTLANGDTMRRDANWRVDSGRSLTGDLMQPAFMQYATGSYDSRSDTRATADGRGQGLYATEQTELLNALSGKQNATVFGNGPKVLGAMQKVLGKGQTVPVVLSVRARATGELKAHSVLVERMQDGQVTFLDPRGRRHTLGLEAFTGRLQSASLPKALVAASLLKASADKRGELAGLPDLWGMVVSGAKAMGGALQEHVVKPVMEHVIQPVVEHVIVPVWEKGVEAARWVDANKEALLGIGAIACAVIPGLQLVSLILAAASAVDSARELYEGIKSGDWKRGLQGAAGLLGAAAAAIGGPLLSKVIGGGATGLARMASGLSRLANGLSDLADVFNDKLDASTRFGRLLSFLAKGVGGSSAAMGESFERAAATFTAVAEKSSNYYDRSVSVFKALTSGPLTLDSGVAVLAGSLSLAGDLNRDHANRENLRFEPGQEKGRQETEQFKNAASYLEVGHTAAKGLFSGDPKQLPGALKTSVALASRIHQDSGSEDQAVKDRLNRSAEYMEQGHHLLNADAGAQAKAAWAIGRKVTEDTGFDWSGVPGVPWIDDRKKAAEQWSEERGRQAEHWTQDRLTEAQRWWDDQFKERTP